MPSEVSISGADQVRCRTSEELEQELAEAREQQVATAEILRIISASTTDLQRVFAAIAASAARFCDSFDATVFLVEGDVLRLVSHHGPIPSTAHNTPLTRGILTSHAVLDRRTIQVADLQAETDAYPESSELARRDGHRTLLAVPLIHAGDPIGAITIRRMEVRPFTDRQIDLLQTFADQAVIAIENTRLFEAEQASKRELQESLEYQTATSAVLNVISRSKRDVQPVFDAIVRSAAELFDPCAATITVREGNQILWRASAAAHNADRVEQMGRMAFPVPFNPERSPSARAMQERRIIEIPDVSELERNALIPAATEFTRTLQAAGVCSIAFVPLLLTDEGIGTIILGHPEPGFRLSQKQRALVQTFADQAVIAIENARLFEAEQARTRELIEALGQQTATADVLKVISRSALDLQRVLDALVESAARLCEANDALIFQVSGDGLRLAAHCGQIPMARPVGQLTIPLVRELITGRAVIDRRTIQVADMLAEADEYPESLKNAVQSGFRTALSVPLVHAGEAIGAIFIRRAEVRPFTERQIELVNTFADQAVIAIENTRLFEEVQARTKELAESLEYQTAISDVLGVINRSKFDLNPVLDTIARVASSLCADDVVIQLKDGEDLRAAAHHGAIPIPLAPNTRRPIGRGWVSGRAVVDRRPIHVLDLASAGDEFPLGQDLAKKFGHRTTLAIPLLREQEALGCLMLRRLVVKSFSENQIALLQTFADQAVIAIENTRLFEEIARKSRELEIASQHKSQFVANMSHELRTPLAAMLGYAELLQEGIYGAPPEKFLPILTRIRSNGKHLLGLINTVLDISKIEAGQFKLNLAEYGLGSIVETVMVATESLAATKKLAFKTEVAKGLPYGLGDEQRLTQVLLNLVGNAIKFTDAGEVRIAAGAANGHFALSVSDTGPGIPAEECETIFEKFRQVDSSNTRAKGGTGLGLAIAREIVEMHGGRIWVESTLGQGSTFRMQLPVRAAVVPGAA